MYGVTDLSGEAARAKVRAQMPDADAQDLLLLDDLLGIGEATVSPHLIDPDERRRRLTAMVNAALLARETPAVYAIEDAHWIDEASESMLVDFIAVIPQTHALVLITYRPEYRGVLARSASSDTIFLAPLNDSHSADSSLSRSARIGLSRPSPRTWRSAPPETRSLPKKSCAKWQNAVCWTAAVVSTGAARGRRRHRSSHTAGDNRSPRRPPEPHAQLTLGAASVIGSRFDTDLFSHLVVDRSLMSGSRPNPSIRWDSPPAPVHIPPPDHACSGRRIAAEIRPRRTASPRRQRDRSAGVADEEAAEIAEHLQGSVTYTPRTLAHARRDVVAETGH